MRAEVLVALRTGAAGEPADGRQHLGPERVGALPLRLGANDLQRARQGDLSGTIAAAELAKLAPVGCHALDDQIDRRNLVEQQVEPLAGGTPNRLEAAGSHPQGRMRLLHRARLDDDALELPAPSAVREAIGGGPRRAQEGHGLLEPLGRLLDRDAKARELRRPIALADAEVQAPVGQEVDRGHLLGQQHRIVPGQHHHRRAEPNPVGAAGQITQEIEGSRQLPDAGEVVFDHEYAVIAELLGMEHIIDVLAVAEAVSHRPFTGRLGPAEQSELHGRAPVFVGASYLVSRGARRRRITNAVAGHDADNGQHDGSHAITRR